MSAAASPTEQPQHTLYINNLNERIKKNDMRQTLYALFSQFGAVLDVVCLRTLRMRGQAHVAFSDPAAAQQAKIQLQGFPLFDKPMNVQFARSKSDAVASLEGNLRDGEVRQRKRQQNKLNGEAVALVASGGKVGDLVKKYRGAEEEEEKGEQQQSGSDRKRKAGDAGGDADAAKRARTEDLRPQDNPPHNVLLLGNLSDDIAEESLNALFLDAPGFVRVRMARVKGRVIAFADFDTAANAGAAMKARQHHVLSENHTMVVSFAKQ